MSPIGPIDPVAASAAPLGGEWQIQSIPDLGAAETALPGVEASSRAEGGFGQALAQQIDNLAALQAEASAQSAALADGTVADPVEAIVAVEKAQVSMQLAAALRTRAVEAVQEIFRTQI